MAKIQRPDRPPFYRSLVFKNILLFLAILLVAVVPLASRYDRDSRGYEIQNLASKLEFFAERGASWLDAKAIATLTRPEDKKTPAYRDLLGTLRRIEKEFGVDNAVVMRRQPDGSYTYVAIGHDRFAIGERVQIHDWFPATYRSTEATWQAGEMMHSKLFGGQVGKRNFSQFLQINSPLKADGQVVAILMLNEFAEPVAAAVRAKTVRVVILTVVIVAVGLALFGGLSSRMLRLLRHLTVAAGRVTKGDLAVSLPPTRSRDEVGRLAVAFDSMIEGLRQRDFIRDTFGRYLSPEVVEELLTSPDGLKLGGELREVTFLVSDLRGFTSMASKLGPQEVIQIINGYLERMVDIITRFGGTVDEFQGDGILAFFGAPLAAADDPERAVACSIEMQNAMEAVNAEQRRRNLPELSMGIGINTGEVIVGNIGSEKRTKYGAIGTTINTAYRIESYTVGSQILTSAATHQRVRDVVRVRATLDVQFKGLDRPVTLYEVAGLEGKYACALPEKGPEEFTVLDEPLPVSFFSLEGKSVSNTAIAGRILRLSDSTADASLDADVVVHSTLMLCMEPVGGDERFEAYAKVAGIEPGAAGLPSARICLRFTSVPESTRAYLNRVRAVASQAGATAARA